MLSHQYESKTGVVGRFSDSKGKLSPAQKGSDLGNFANQLYLSPSVVSTEGASEAGNMSARSNYNSQGFGIGAKYENPSNSFIVGQ